MSSGGLPTAQGRFHPSKAPPTAQGRFHTLPRGSSTQWRFHPLPRRRIHPQPRGGPCVEKRRDKQPMGSRADPETSTVHDQLVIHWRKLTTSATTAWCMCHHSPTLQICVTYIDVKGSSEKTWGKQADQVARLSVTIHAIYVAI